MEAINHPATIGSCFQMASPRIAQCSQPQMLKPWPQHIDQTAPSITPHPNTPTRVPWALHSQTGPSIKHPTLHWHEASYSDQIVLSFLEKLVPVSHNSGTACILTFVRVHVLPTHVFPARSRHGFIAHNEEAPGHTHGQFACTAIFGRACQLLTGLTSGLSPGKSSASCPKLPTIRILSYVTLPVCGWG